MIFASAVTAKYAEHSLWVSALINLALDGLIIYFALLIGEKFPNKTLFEIFSLNLGKFLAKFIFVLFAVLFFLKAYIPINEQKFFVEISLYETFPKIITFMPFFVFSAYLSYKGLKGIARCSDVMVYLTVISISALIGLSMTNADLTKLLPIFNGVSFKKIAEGSFKSGIWYFDGLYALMMVGRYKKEKLYKTKIISEFCLSALLAISFMIFLYAEYGALTERQYFAPVKIGLLAVALLNVGRIDFIAALVLTCSNVFATALPLLFSSYCIMEVFGIKNSKATSISVNLAMAVCLLLLKDSFMKIFQIFQNFYAFLPLFMIVVILFVLFFFKKGSVKNEK